MHYKKVLLLGNCYDGNLCEGVTTNSLFGNWPKEKLAAIGTVDHFPRDSVIGLYYCIGEEEYEYLFPLNYMFTIKSFGSRVIVPDKNAQQVNTNIKLIEKTRTTLFREIIKKWQRYILKRLDAQEVILKTKLSSGLIKWISDYQPEIIYTILGSLRSIRFANNIADITGASLVVHIMDDWPEIIHRGGLFSFYFRKRMKIELKALFQKSKCRLVISQAMADIYNKRYKIDFTPFHNSIEISIWEQNRKTTWEAGSPFRILYTGGIGVAKLESIVFFAEAIRRLNKKGLKVKLELVTANYNNPRISDINNPGVVELLPPVEHDDIPALLAGADLLLLPIDFDKKSIRYTRYSMPTKVSEYMASGTPVLVFAPEETAVFQYASRENWALTIGKQDINIVMRTITELYENEKTRKSLGQHAMALASRNHDSKKIRHEFDSLILDN